MKWWGWGDESTAFTDADKPELRPFIRRHLATDIATATGAPVTFARSEEHTSELQSH